MRENATSPGFWLVTRNQQLFMQKNINNLVLEMSNMKYWLKIIFILIFFLTGCQAKTIQPVDKSEKVSQGDKILINDNLEQKYLDNLKKSLGNIQIIRTIKLFFDKDNEQELIILYNNIENNSRSNIAVINSHGIHAIDLASNDHDYAFTDPNNIQVIEKESEPNEIIIPLFNQRLNHVVDFHITMETEGKTCTFKIKSELSK